MTPKTYKFSVCKTGVVYKKEESKVRFVLHCSLVIMLQKYEAVSSVFETTLDFPNQLHVQESKEVLQIRH
jgi:hypothetical protein